MYIYSTQQSRNAGLMIGPPQPGIASTGCASPVRLLEEEEPAALPAGVKSGLGWVGCRDECVFVPGLSTLALTALTMIAARRREGRAVLNRS